MDPTGSHPRILASTPVARCTKSPTGPSAEDLFSQPLLTDPGVGEIPIFCLRRLDPVAAQRHPGRRSRRGAEVFDFSRRPKGRSLSYSVISLGIRYLDEERLALDLYTVGTSVGRCSPTETVLETGCPLPAVGGVSSGLMTASCRAPAGPARRRCPTRVTPASARSVPEPASLARCLAPEPTGGGARIPPPLRCAPRRSPSPCVGRHRAVIEGIPAVSVSG